MRVWVEWDMETDEEIDLELPIEWEIPDSIHMDQVADWLSDQTDFCVLDWGRIN